MFFFTTSSSNLNPIPAFPTTSSGNLNPIPANEYGFTTATTLARPKTLRTLRGSGGDDFNMLFSL